MTATMARKSNEAAGTSAPVSARERQVLSRIAAGKTSKQIAADLGISLSTVNTHRENIAKKLGTSSVAAFIRYALDNGLTDPV